MTKAIIGLTLIFVPIYFILATLIQALLKGIAKDTTAALDIYGKKEFFVEAHIMAVVCISPFLGTVILCWR